MKPDKHKQKRSQQYKNKHDIKSDKADSTRKNNDHAPAKAHTHSSTSSSTSSQSASRNEGSNKKVDSLKVKNVEEKESDDEGKDDEILFRKRVLVSNWDRYEELPQDEYNVNPRGADFSLLLQNTTTAISRFRFADELELDEDLDDFSLNAPCLSVNPQDLAAAFNCIPTHLKLDINEKYFEEKDIQHFEKECEKNRQIYKTHIKQSYHASSSASQGSVLKHDNDSELDATLDRKSKSDYLDVEPAFDRNPELGLDRNPELGLDRNPELGLDRNPELGLDRNPELGLDRNPEPALDMNPELGLDILDDLDAILARDVTKDDSDPNVTLDIMGYIMDRNVEECVDKDNTAFKCSRDDDNHRLLNGLVSNVVSATKHATFDIEDELDKILSLDKGNSNSKTDVENIASNSVTDQDTDDLEDWLDSVLGD